MPEPSPARTPLPGSPAELLSLGLGAGSDGLEFEASLELGDFLCACPELQLHSCLGRGGMGVVYRARQVRLGRDVAIKLMNPEVSRHPELARRFEREAKALARLDHLGIVRVHDFGQAGGVCYLVMELVDGPNLRVLIDQGLSDAQACDIVDQLCDALACAHGQGVVHRDIKPENVLVDRRGRVRVADFGLAKLQAEPLGGATRTRRVLGTPQYMAPEQLRDPDSVDQRCDIFAIGVVFYEMLTGQLPVGRFPAPSELGRGSTRIDEIVMRALESNRERRFQTASEIRAALSSIGAGPHATKAEAAPRRRLWWAGGMAAAVAVAGLVWRLIPSDEPVDATPVASIPMGPEIVPMPVVPDAAKQRNRWPAPELAILDHDVVGVAGIDWSELRPSPAVAKLSALALAQRPIELVRCKQDVLDRTHKVVAAFTSTGLRELVIHGDWEPSQLQPCLDELAKVRRPDGGPMPEFVEATTLGPYRRFVARGGEDQGDVTVTIAHAKGRVIVSLRDDVTVEQLEAKLVGEPTSTALRDRVIESVDLSAPLWIFAEPGPGRLPWGMLSLRGGIELWNELVLDVSATFPDEATASKAETLAQSYANIVSAVPDFPIPPVLTVAQQDVMVRVQGTIEIPDHVRRNGMELDLGRVRATQSNPVLPGIQ